MVELTAGFFIAWTVITAWWMGKVLACLDAIAKQLLKVPLLKEDIINDKP
jgi:hypothetical protein